MSNDETKETLLDQLLGLVGFKEPRRVVEKVLEGLVKMENETARGALDIQAMYSEVESKLRELFLDEWEKKIDERLARDLPGVPGKIREGIEGARIHKAIDSFLKSFKITDTLNRAPELDPSNPIKKAARVADLKIKESPLQERIENAICYLQLLGIEDPQGEAMAILDKLGLESTFEKVRNILGLDEPLVLT